MLVVTDKEGMKEILAFAVDNDCLDKIVDQLHYLTNYGPGDDTKSKCVLGHDLAPLSMGFMMHSNNNNQDVWEPWFNGGLLYSGPGIRLHGGAPSFSVSLNDDAKDGKTHMWSVHT